MREIVFNSGDYATLLADAKKLGFIDADGNIVTNGVLEDGGGWFLNICGLIYETITEPVDIENPPPLIAKEGYWGRLRVNGTPKSMPEFSNAITQYVYQTGTAKTPGKWVNAATKDPAPDWVADVGVIA